MVSGNFLAVSEKSGNFFYPDELATLIFTKLGSLPSVTVVTVDLRATCGPNPPVDLDPMNNICYWMCTIFQVSFLISLR